MKIGTKLIAIDPCIREEGVHILTVRKEYEILILTEFGLDIVGDDGEVHAFGLSEYETYFQSITPESLEELGFESRFRYPFALVKENLANNLRVIVYSDGRVESEYLGNHMPYKECKTLTDLKHLIRILGV